MTSAEYRDLHQKPTATARKPAPTPKSSSSPAPAQQTRETEAAVALVKRGPVRWAVAEPDSLHAKQYPGAFRLVVIGHQEDLPAVLAALNQMNP